MLMMSRLPPPRLDHLLLVGTIFSSLFFAALNHNTLVFCDFPSDERSDASVFKLTVSIMFFLCVYMFMNGFVVVWG